jgi:hypothetical protein
MLSFLGKIGLNEGKDAVRLGMMKFLSSNQPIKSEALKAAINFADHAYKGETILNKGVENIFKPGVQVITSAQFPSHEQIMKLDKLVAKNQQNPNNLMQSQSDSPLGHYAPEHQQN